MPHVNSAPPGQGAFRGPLLQSLGRATCYRANQYIPKWLVVPMTLRLAGIDPNRPQWPRKGVRPIGLDRKIENLWHYLKRKEVKEAPNKPILTCTGAEPGLWGLTEEGIRLVREMDADRLRKFSKRKKSGGHHRCGWGGGVSVDTDLKLDLATLLAGCDEDSLRGSVDYQRARKELRRWGYLRMKAQVGDREGGPQLLDAASEARAMALLDGGHADRAARSCEVIVERAVETVGDEGSLFTRMMSLPPNLTACWLGEHLHLVEKGDKPKTSKKDDDDRGGATESRLYKAMRAAVASKCPVSASSRQVEDHISECILRLIHRDSLRNRIMLGKPITYSHLCTYAIRSAWTDARNSATNPVCRELFGARTETERKRMKEQGETRRWRINDPRVSLRRHEDGVAMLMDIAVDDRDLIEDALFFQSVWDKLLDEIMVGKPRVWERYSMVLKVKLQGGGVHEVADVMKVSPSRATSMISETRKVLRRARDRGAFASFGY